MKTCKTLHLAFKTKTPDEIYDILMEQLIRAIRQYDHEYSTKTRQIVETINDKLSQFRQITILDVHRHLEFDCAGHDRARSIRKFFSLRRAPKRLEVVGRGLHQLE
jgi:hypothetical protein